MNNKIPIKYIMLASISASLAFSTGAFAKVNLKDNENLCESCDWEILEDECGSVDDQAHPCPDNKRDAVRWSKKPCRDLKNAYDIPDNEESHFVNILKKPVCEVKE